MAFQVFELCYSRSFFLPLQDEEFDFYVKQSPKSSRGLTTKIKAKQHQY